MPKYSIQEVENEDGIVDAFSIRSDDYDEPLFGDYRGVELCLIHFIPSRPDSVSRAKELAEKFLNSLT